MGSWVCYWLVVNVRMAMHELHGIEASLVLKALLVLCVIHSKHDCKSQSLDPEARISVRTEYLSQVDFRKTKA